MAAERMDRATAQQVAARLIQAGVYFEAVPLDGGQTMITVNDGRLPLLMRAVEQVKAKLSLG